MKEGNPFQQHVDQPYFSTGKLPVTNGGTTPSCVELKLDPFGRYWGMWNVQVRDSGT